MYRAGNTGQRRRSSARREHRRRREIGKVIKPGRVPKQLRVSLCKEETARLLGEKALEDEVFGVESELIDGSDLEDLVAAPFLRWPWPPFRCWLLLLAASSSSSPVTCSSVQALSVVRSLWLQVWAATKRN